MAEQVDITVGSGPVQRSTIYTQIASLLVGLGSFITTITGSLPEGVDPAIGLGLTVFAGVVATASQFVLMAGRSNFAKAKAEIIAGRSALPVIEEAFDADDEFEDVDAPLDPQEPKSDTDVVPPQEPA